MKEKIEKEILVLVFMVFLMQECRLAKNVVSIAMDVKIHQKIVLIAMTHHLELDKTVELVLMDTTIMELI